MLPVSTLSGATVQFCRGWITSVSWGKRQFCTFLARMQVWTAHVRFSVNEGSCINSPRLFPDVHHHFLSFADLFSAGYLNPLAMYQLCARCYGNHIQELFVAILSSLPVSLWNQPLARVTQMQLMQKARIKYTVCQYDAISKGLHQYLIQGKK